MSVVRGLAKDNKLSVVQFVEHRQEICSCCHLHLHRDLGFPFPMSMRKALHFALCNSVFSFFSLIFFLFVCL